MKEQSNENSVEIKETKRGFHPDFISLGIKLLILIGFIFILIFAITNFNKNKENTTFKNNIELMRSSAYLYFKDEENRPIEENEEIDISLADMIETEMIDELKTSKKVICDKNQSGIAITKISDSKYNLDVSLTCGKKSKTENYTLNYSSLKKESSSNKIESNTNKNETSEATTTNNNTTEEKNNGTTMYELRRTIQDQASYQCPEGFTLIGTKCYSNVTVLKASAVPIYDVKPEKNVPASYKREEVDYEYTYVIEKKGITSLKCPSGYNLVNNTCQKIENPYPKSKTTYSCPSGFTLNGTKCTMTTALTTKPASYKCSKGTLTSDNRCKVTTNAIETCNAGQYDSSKKMCYITIDAVAIYNDWKDVGEVKTKKEKQNTTTALYTYLGRTSNGYYRYRKATRTVKRYSCVSGTYVGNGKCRIYNASYSKYTCKNGTLSGKKCISYTAATVNKTSSTCPSGYSKANNKCVKTINATKKNTQTYYCKAGSTVTSDKKCLTTTTPTTVTGKNNYICPSGYELTGSGSSSKCRKKVVTPGYYYCKNDDAVLDNNRCITASEVSFKGYKCPKGYELAGNYCYKYTKDETIKATKIAGNIVREEVIWSASKRLDGWTFTGNTKKA